MKKNLGKRERMARKRKISMRKTGHLFITSKCALCSMPGTWKFGPSKSNKIGFGPKRLLCGQCRRSDKTRAGVPAVGF